MYYLGRKLYFKKDDIYLKIINSFKYKGPKYVVLIDNNLSAESILSQKFRFILKNSYMNIMDGSFFAFIYNIIFFKRINSFHGGMLFSLFINNSSFRQLILGPPEHETKVLINNLKSKNVFSLELPFCSIEQFDNHIILSKINDLNPDIVWVSLGAPKQENLIYSLIKCDSNNRLYIGSGAAFKFYHETLTSNDFSILGLKFIWLIRLYQEPRKQLKRFLRFLPTLPIVIFLIIFNNLRKS